MRVWAALGERARKRGGLLADLGTLAYNITHTALDPAAKIVITTRPTPLRQKAFALLGANPARTQ